MLNLLVFAAPFIVYLGALAPSITVGDAGELCAAGATLGIAHAPGYPLFGLLAKAATVAVPLGNIAYRVNLLSAFFGALTVVLLYRALRIYAAAFSEKPAARWGAAAAALLFAFTPAFWNSAVQTEVFTLNAFFAAGILYALLEERLLLAAYLFGLGLGNHHTLVFLAPLAGYAALRQRALTVRKVLLLALMFALGFSVYLYLPVRAAKNPALDWGHATTVHRFWRVLSRADYGSLSLTTGEKMERSPGTTVRQMTRFVRSMGREVSFPIVALGCAGIVLGLRKRDRWTPAFLATWFLAGPGFLLLANMPFDPETEGIMERFNVLINLFWAFPVAAACVKLLSLVRRREVAAALSLALPAVFVAADTPAFHWRDYYLACDYGRNLLKTLPPSALFLMDGGDDTFYSTAYFCFAEKRRPDIALHDRGGVVFKSIYGTDFRQLSRGGKEERRRAVEEKYIGTRPVYYSTFNRSALPGRVLEADGMLYRAGGRKADAGEMYSLRNVYDAELPDYRSRALAPLYPYFEGVRREGERLAAWEYAYGRWPDAKWLAGNLKIEIAQEGYRKFIGGDYAGAAAAYGTLTKLWPEDAGSLVNLGVIQEKLGRRDAAKGFYRRAIEADERCVDAYYNLAVVYWQESNWEEVVRNMERLLALNPVDPRAQRYLPLARMRLEKKAH